jgi:hypothetical protein
MGSPLYSDNVGQMCYNPAKNWQLGWYTSNELLFNPFTAPFSWTGSMVGIADFENNPDNHTVVLKIESDTSEDIFIGFNRATGVNSDNDEADNEVTIIESGNNGEGYSQSSLKAHLTTGENYTFFNWTGTGRSLVITANDIDIVASPGYAVICVSYDGAICNDGSSTASPTNPPANAPTNPPTYTPTNPPTNSPTNPLTNPPTNSPTNPPTTPAPTFTPTELPTNVSLGFWCTFS